MKMWMSEERAVWGQAAMIVNPMRTEAGSLSPLWWTDMYKQCFFTNIGFLNP